VRLSRWLALIFPAALVACGTLLSAVESEPPADAAAEDAFLGVDAGPARFCDSHGDAAFCADFDGVDYRQGLTFDFYVAATVAEDTTSFASAPRSARVTKGYYARGSPGHARLAVALPPATEVEVEAKFRLASAPEWASFTPLVVRFGPDREETRELELAVEAISNGTMGFYQRRYFYYPDGGHTMNGTGFITVDAAVFSEWKHLRMRIVTEPADARSMTVRIDDGAERAMSLFSAPIGTPMTVMLGLSNAYQMDAGTWEINVDDVVVTTLR
jgi:hypothetical protein